MARTKKNLVFLDTHVVVWLSNPKKLSKLAKAAIEGGDLYVSPMVELELRFLYEIKRLLVDEQEILRILADRIGLQKSEAPFQSVVSNALNIAWTRDPFDRMIVAEAMHFNGKLLSADKLILKHFQNAIW